MRRTVLLLVLLLSAVGVVSYFFARQRTTPSIAILSPAGGEAWQAGEAHTIRWQSVGVPASEKVAITIQRMPPPPIPEEGQEFDPIVFTDLSNSGSTTWTISPMYPSGTYVLGISAYDRTPVLNPISAESAEFTISHPSLLRALSPLYSAAQWNKMQIEEVTMGTTTLIGASVSSAPSESTMDPGSIFTPFVAYYDRALKAAGFAAARDLEAGGHVGGQSGYRKGGETVLTRFHVDYSLKPEDAPSECPCTVTLSLFWAP